MVHAVIAHAPPVGQRFEAVACGALSAHGARLADAASHQVEVVAFARLAEAHADSHLRSWGTGSHRDVTCTAKLETRGDEALGKHVRTVEVGQRQSDRVGRTALHIDIVRDAHLALRREVRVGCDTCITCSQRSAWIGGARAKS